MASQKSDLPQGTLDLLILQIVALGPIHGYAIAQRLQQISRDVVQVQQGSLYPALHRLEKRGFLAATWKLSDTGRDAKFYRLTPKGRAQLKEETANWARLADAVRLILGTAEGGMPWVGGGASGIATPPIVSWTPSSATTWNVSQPITSLPAWTSGWHGG